MEAKQISPSSKNNSQSAHLQGVRQPSISAKNSTANTFMTGIIQRNAVADEFENSTPNTPDLNPTNQVPSYIEIHNHLNDMIDGFDEQVEQVLEKQELDFIAAYRKHMIRVQKDLEQLKKRLNEQDYLMRRSDRIAALENEVSWYREESLVQSKTIAYLKEENNKSRALAEDAQMQAAELQAVVAKYQRKAKLLKAALSKTQSECVQLVQSQTAAGSLMLRDNSLIVQEIAAEGKQVHNGGDLTQATNNQDNMLKPSFSKLSKEEKNKLYTLIQKGDHLKRQWLKSNEVNPQKPSLSSYDLMKQLVEIYHQNDQQRLVYEVSKIVDQKCDNLALKISELTYENKTIQDEYIKTKRYLLSKFGDTANINPVQRAFVECIDSVKKEIEKRRYLQAQCVPYDKEGGIIDPKEVKRPLPDKFMTLEQFSAQDKQQVIDLAFQHPEILKGLYQLMFWQKRAQVDPTTPLGQDLYNKFMTDTLRIYDLHDNPFALTKAGSDIETINHQILSKLDKSSTSGFTFTKNKLLSSSTLGSPMNIPLAATAQYDDVEPLDFLKKLDEQNQNKPASTVFGHFDSFVKQKQIPASSLASTQNISNKFGVSRYPQGFKNGLEVEKSESFVKLQKQRPMSSVQHTAIHPQSATNHARPTTATLFNQTKRSSMTRFQRPCTRQSTSSAFFKNVNGSSSRPMTGNTSPSHLNNMNQFIRHVRNSSQQVPSKKQVDQRLKKRIEGINAENLMLDEDMNDQMMHHSNINIIHSNNVSIRQVVQSSKVPYMN